MDIDPLRSPARVVDGKLRGVCDPCAADDGLRARARAEPPASPSAPVAHEPTLEPAANEAAEDAGSRGPWRARSWRVYALGVAAAVALAVAATQARSSSPAAVALTGAAPNVTVSQPGVARAAARGDLAEPWTEHSADHEPHHATSDESDDDTEYDDEGIEELTPEELPPTLEDMWEDTGEPLENRLPTLMDWVFPVLRSTETFPLKASRRFGAQREGKRVAKCGRGHCGVDLEGTKGTPVLAVAFGEVVRIERGTRKRSGRYVRIEHPDYVYTSYMHLDRIADGLEVGDEIEPGQVLGTVGRTGVKESMPHLHFSLEVPIEGKLKHVDPAPFLQRASHLNDPSEAYETVADE